MSTRCRVDLDWKEITVESRDLPKKLKKITGTRFASILGLNKWNTPFKTWCEITKVYEEPFEDSIYTKAGKEIEPKVCEYLNKRYFMDLKTPTDVYGKDYFKTTWGDFFHDDAIFGGMWDFINDDTVIEVKTTKRVEDWINSNGDIEPPAYYELQACLYAYLLGYDNVILTCTVLEDKDYLIPQNFEVNETNTFMYEFKMSEKYPNFKEDYIDEALAWYDDYLDVDDKDYIKSPQYDDVKDKDIIKALTTVQVDDNVPMSALISEIERIDEEIESKKKRLDELKSTLKELLEAQMGVGDSKAEINGRQYKWTLSKKKTTRFDSTKFKTDYPQQYKSYLKTSESLELRKSKLKDE